VADARCGAEVCSRSGAPSSGAVPAVTEPVSAHSAAPRCRRPLASVPAAPQSFRLRAALGGGIARIWRHKALGGQKRCRVSTGLAATSANVATAKVLS
jgi:hypothetical protein